MPQNFLTCDRDQPLLLPPDLRDWLAEDHLAWFVIEDVAFRVITANQAPDHATIARFRVRHQEALADLFGQVLGLCARAGIVETGVLAVDGSKLEASASNHATRGYEQIAKEIVVEAGRIDAAEDELHGEARGDELPEKLTTRHGRSGCGRPGSNSSKSGPSRPSRSRGIAASALRSAIAA